MCSISTSVSLWTWYLTRNHIKTIKCKNKFFGRIFKQTSYTISADLKKHKNNITEFDILYNPINSKEFEDSKLNRELKFDYEFDKNGNWIKKNVSMKEHFNNSKEFVPIYVDTRKISYWK